MKSILKTIVVATALSLAAVAGAQENFPSKRITWIVPFAPGGAMDTMARTLAEKMSLSMKQPIIIENRPGAGGTIGSDVVARAEPDGHTIMIVSVGHAVNPSLFPKLRYDPVKDFEPVSLVANVPNILVVHPSVKATSVKELIALAKAESSKLAYASAGTGTTLHLAGELFNNMAKVEILHVPYKGSAPAIQDLLGGQVPMMFDSVTSAKPHIESGRVHPLAVTTPKRSSVFPNVPTIAEAALPGYDLSGWYAVFAPAKTPKPVIDKLQSEIVKAMNLPDVRQRFAQIGAEPVGSSPAELGAYLNTEVSRWAGVVRERNIRPD